MQLQEVTLGGWFDMCCYLLCPKSGGVCLNAWQAQCGAVFTRGKLSSESLILWHSMSDGLVS